MRNIAVGIFIVIASLVLIGVALAFKSYSFRKRWDVSRFGGILVRFDRGAALTPELGHALMVVNQTLVDLLWSIKVPPIEWRVEIVPPGEVRTQSIPAGRLPDGKIAGGSVRIERAMPFADLIFVAVVAVDHDGPKTARLIAHEVCSHIVPYVRGDGWNLDHKLAGYSGLEIQAKEKIKLAIGAGG